MVVVPIDLHIVLKFIVYVTYTVPSGETHKVYFDHFYTFVSLVVAWPKK